MAGGRACCGSGGLRRSAVWEASGRLGILVHGWRSGVPWIRCSNEGITLGRHSRSRLLRGSDTRQRGRTPSASWRQATPPPASLLCAALVSVATDFAASHGKGAHQRLARCVGCRRSCSEWRRCGGATNAGVASTKCAPATPKVRKAAALVFFPTADQGFAPSVRSMARRDIQTASSTPGTSGAGGGGACARIERRLIRTRHS